MKKIIFIYLAFLALYSCSCNNTRNQIRRNITQWDSKELFLPKTNIKLVYFKHADTLNFKRSGVKIVTAIDGSCSTCIEDLKNWEIFMSKALKVDPDIVFNAYISATSFPYFEEIYEKEIPYRSALIYDYDDQFAINNKLPQDNKMYKAFLIDEKNKVLIVGNPAISKKIENLYLNELKSIRNK